MAEEKSQTLMLLYQASVEAPSPKDEAARRTPVQPAPRESRTPPQKSNNAGNRVRITTRLPADLYAALTRRADQTQRSVNAEIIHTLRRSLARSHGKAA